MSEWKDKRSVPAPDAQKQTGKFFAPDAQKQTGKASAPAAQKQTGKFFAPDVQKRAGKASVPKGQKHSDAPGVAAVLGSIVRKNAALAAGTLLVIAGSVAAALFPPLVLGSAVDALTAGQGVSLRLALLYFGLLALAGVLEAAQNVVITCLGQRITHGLRSALCAKLRRLPAAFFTQNEPGQVTSRFVSDVDTVDTLFTSGIVSMFADVCKVVSIVAVIFWKSLGLGLLLVLVTPALFAMTRWFQRRMLAAQMDNRAAVGRLNNHIPETIRNLRMVRVFNRQGYMERRYDEFLAQSYRATDKVNMVDAVYSPIVVCISACVVAVMMVCAALGGGWRSFFGIGVGTAVAVIAYVGKVFEPLEDIGMEIQNIQSAVAGAKRIDTLLRAPERTLPPEAQTPAEDAAALQKTTVPAGKEAPQSAAAAPADAEGVRPAAAQTEEKAAAAAVSAAAGPQPAPDSAVPAVEFSHVSFGYGGDADVLHDLSFAVAAGESVVFTGRTGAGKSTVFRLLLGLYEPDAGHVRLGGTDVSRIPEAGRRARIGYVEQAFALVEGSVAQQITLGDPAVTRADAEAAARLVGLHDIIAALPQGYDTPAAQAAFSQGQLQLLSIARAVAASPRILLLDEITANLDLVTERRVLDALARAGEGRTVLSISHRAQPRAAGQREIVIGAQAQA